jgi:hypothetical protein
MANTTINYRGHEVLMGTGAGPPSLSIDGDVIPVSQVTESDYATHLLPYANFPSLDALARAVIDHSPQFSGRRDRT